MFTQYFIDQLTPILNESIRLQCREEAACIRNCICEIKKIQQRHIPIVPVTILSDEVDPKYVQQFANIPSINWYGQNVVNKPK